jgi:predicted transcriptional regulator
MRTTLTIGDDIDQRIRYLAQKQNRTYKEAINEALAAGLKQLEVVEPSTEYKIESACFGLKEGIDDTKLNQLYDEIEGTL